MKPIDQKTAAAIKTTHLACTHFSHWLCRVCWRKTVPRQAAWITSQQQELQIPALCLSTLLKGKQRGQKASVYFARLALSEIIRFTAHMQIQITGEKSSSNMLIFPTLLEKGKKTGNTT